MPDGGFDTLEAVVKHYNGGGDRNPQQDEEIYALDLTDEEQRDLITFLREGLSSPDYPYLETPELP